MTSLEETIISIVKENLKNFDEKKPYKITYYTSWLGLPYITIKCSEYDKSFPVWKSISNVKQLTLSN